MTGIPFHEKEDFPEDYGYYFPSASGTDMTGLIPFSAGNETDALAYSDIYPYLADGFPEGGREMRQKKKL